MAKASDMPSDKDCVIRSMVHSLKMPTLGRLTLYHTIQTFNDFERKAFRKHSGKSW